MCGVPRLFVRRRRKDCHSRLWAWFSWGVYQELVDGQELLPPLQSSWDPSLKFSGM
ncbi:probable E3 ubiquitin-protein ligase hip1 [Phtheirospermum japonicum]|uniref:Probable E3 ubiquitin-protein ligase hip1 n=1 Tax=Phtheirospermum japonicum TaxID=374723 RepID=A0A830CY53_9LAMI|nr:probable E3 ubiquitin-protein ligase hip1 [Phtheirospermum japonicum]